MEGDTIHIPTVDTIVNKVINNFVRRAEFGKKKYGTDLDRTDLTTIEWVQHAIEEHMDSILYLERIKRDLEEARDKSLDSSNHKSNSKIE
jgi:hypothetical protein